MANYTTVQDVVNIVSAVILEPYDSGAAPGPSLGIVSMSDILTLFSVVILDFLNRTGLNWSIFTTPINFGTSQYQFPEDLNEVKVCFLGGQYIDHSTLSDLDDWEYDWKSKFDTPLYWHSDGLPPKTIEVAANPNYTGAPYAIPVGPTPQPPFGIYGLLNGATQGQFSGTLTTNGTAATWNSGNLFDLNWNNYAPCPNITIAGTVYPISSVTDATDLVLDFSAGTQSTVAWSVNIGNDGNLTMIGTTALDSITYTLAEIIPVVPDSFCFYLAYGVLARIFSTEGEAKDLQRAYYCLSRYSEGISAASAVSGEISAIG